MKKADWLWSGLGIVVLVGGFVLAVRAMANHPSNGWTKSLGGAYNDSVNLTITDSNGNLFIAGTFGSTAVDLDIMETSHPFDMGVSTPSVFMSKYNSDESYGWTITMDGNGSTITATGIATDAGGNVYLAGYIDYTSGDPQIDLDGTEGSNLTNFSDSGKYGFVSMYTSEGAYGWSRVLGNANNEVYVNGLSVDSDGASYVTGGFAGSSVEFDVGGTGDMMSSNGDRDIFVTKFGADGSYGWTSAFGGLGTDEGFRIASDEAGNIYATMGIRGGVDFEGTVLNPVGSQDGVLLKLSASDGSVIWMRQLSGSAGDETLLLRGLAVDHGNGIYVGGHFLGTAMFVGETMYNNTGDTSTSDLFLAKYDNSGNLLWQKGIGGMGNEILNSLTTDDDNNVIFTGSFENSVDFDGGTGSDNKSSNGHSDIFVSKYRSDGNYDWTRSGGGTEYEEGTDVSYGGANKFFAGGMISSINIDFGDEGSSNLISTNGGYDGIVILINDIGEPTETPTATPTGDGTTEPPTVTPTGDGSTEPPTVTPTGDGTTETPTESPTGTVSPSPTPTTIVLNSETEFDPTQLDTDGYLLIPSGGSLESSTQVEFPYRMQINIGAHQVILPENLVVTASTGESLSPSSLSASQVNLSNLSGLNNIVAAVQWGIQNFGLDLSDSLEVLLNVGASYEGQTLQVSRSLNGTSWTTEGLSNTSCVVSSGVCSIISSKASYFAAYTQPTQQGTDNSSHPSSSSPPGPPGPPGPPRCGDAAPANSPDLFRIEVTKKQATLHFTPVAGPVSYYYIAYSAKNDNAEEHGVMFNKGPYPGELSFTINNLQLNKKYNFKVRGGNGCMPGEWSNILSAKTSYSSRKLIYYKPMPKPSPVKKTGN